MVFHEVQVGAIVVCRFVQFPTDSLASDLRYLADPEFRSQSIYHADVIGILVHLAFNMCEFDSGLRNRNLPVVLRFFYFIHLVEVVQLYFYFVDDILQLLDVVNIESLPNDEA